MTIKHVGSPSLIEKIEDAIVAGVKAGVDGSVKVDAFPANPESYDFANLKAAVLIHYSSSQFTARKGGAITAQTRRMNFSLVLFARELRGHTGSYSILEDLRLALQAQVFAGAGPAEIVKDELISEQHGQWRWEIVIGLNIPAIARERLTPAALMQPARTTLVEHGASQ